MRIISGILKGKKINYIKNSTTRPLKDSVKENIFNILKHSNLVECKMENSTVLDLYSGVGSFGIECISRGAKKVTFIEKDKNAINVLEENLLRLSIYNKSVILKGKIEDELKIKINKKFNFFFFDPPFKDVNFIENLRLIKNKKFFLPKNLVIIHREKKSFDDFSNICKIIDTKLYGRSKIIFGIFK